MRKQLLSIGEAMVELAPTGSSSADNIILRQGFAGDTFNTAFYARQTLPQDWQVNYFTLLGQDALSDAMVRFIESKNIRTDYIKRHPSRMPGLYMVHLDNGERSFSYWRSQSAARLLAQDQAILKEAIDQSDIIVFSGITLAILEDEGADNLLSGLHAAKETGKTIAFDPNIRPRLWRDADKMRTQLIRGAQASNLVLPSLDDEMAHFQDRSAAETIERYRSYGLNRIIVKNGAGTIEAYFDGEHHSTPIMPVQTIIDTTGAGDSFNGAFLGHFALTGDVDAAIKQASGTAAKTIQHYGALVD